ncbi:MAG TPA: diguanylate cyclase [Bryobacteraceae bacterium]|nr:diguanylate cyclase [Bryobacteraceae bacterium]
MISLKQYLFSVPRESAESDYRRVIGLLIRGLFMHAVEGEKDEYETFRAEIDRLESAITNDSEPSELLRVAGAAMRSLEEYNYRTSRFMRQQSVELQKMIAMFSKTLIAMGSGSERSVDRLYTIEKRLDRMSVIEDMGSLKSNLADCLEGVREEALREKFEGNAALEKLKQELADVRDRLGSAPQAVDSVTGLASYEEARRALQAAVVSPKQRYVVTAVVGNVQAVNAKFGYTAGDRLLNVFREHFASGLRQSDALYRWRGPVLTAIIEREESIERVRADIHRFTDTKLETMLEVGTRKLLMRISAAWSIFPVREPLGGLMKNIESFIAAQVFH